MDELDIEKIYKKIEKEYKKTVEEYKRGYRTEAEIEELENRLFEIECLSSTY